MKRILIITLICIFTLLTDNLYALNIACSINPIAFLVNKIGGERVKVVALLKPGEEPHHFNPNIKRVLKVSKSDVYLKLAFKEENKWIKALKSVNSNLKVVDLTRGIKFRTLERTHNGKDPHIWISLNNLRIISKNILNALIEFDSNNKEFYISNFNSYLKRLNHVKNRFDKTKIKIKKVLIFHPSLGYLLDELGIIQLPVEVEGKEVSIKEMMNIINIARKSKIRAIFLEEQFNPKLTKLLANYLDCKIIKFNPLKSDILSEIEKIISRLPDE